jgi:arginase
VDAHADFATPEQSLTGSAASMCLALAAGRGDSTLARLGGDEPLVRERDVVVLGRRDQAETTSYGEGQFEASAVLDLSGRAVRESGPAAAAHAALERLTAPGVTGFWVHVDADVLDPSVVPAVDSPEPDGLALEELGELLAPLVRHPRALGMQLTIYDPALDPDGSSAERLAALLERAIPGAVERAMT